nr:flagellin [Planctomycetota bacterium]
QFHLFGLGEVATVEIDPSTTIQNLVDAINTHTGTTGAVASYDAATGALSVSGQSGPLELSSDDLTAGGAAVGLLDLRTDLINDTGATRISTSPNVTADLTVTDDNGTTHTIRLTSVPGRDGGRTLTNLLPGPEMAPPWSGFLPGAFSATMHDTSDRSFGSSITAQTTTLTATRSKNQQFQTGARSGETIQFEIADMRARALGHSAGLATMGLADLQDLIDEEVFLTDRAQDAISVIDAAIEEVASARGAAGVTQSQGLEQIISTLRLGSENLGAAESRIRDMDMAYETAEYARFNVQMQAATSMLGQANQIPESVLQLLQ